MIDAEQFRWRLTETISWCSHQANSFPQYCNARVVLREPVLRPLSLEYMTPDSDPLRSSMGVRDAGDIRRIIDVLNKERALLLRWNFYRDSKYPATSANDLAEGRLLLYSPHENLADGASEVETDGFFDVNNEPPWDTWIDFITYPVSFRGAEPERTFGDVVCWIPPAFVPLAERGIMVNPEVCIEWADQSSGPVARLLREAGFLG